MNIKPVAQTTVSANCPECNFKHEFLLEKGAIDLIVDRRQMRDQVAQFVTLLQKEPLPVT